MIINFVLFSLLNYFEKISDVLIPGLSYTSDLFMKYTCQTYMFQKQTDALQDCLRIY